MLEKLPNIDSHIGIWPNLASASVEQNRDFARKIFELNLANSEYWFDYLDCNESWSRQSDPDMTLDIYLENINEKTFYTLCLGREENFRHDWKQVQVISLCYKANPFPGIKGDKFLWYKTPYNLENFNKVDELFQDIYKVPILDFKRRGE